jgi:hypothetical protein
VTAVDDDPMIAPTKKKQEKQKKLLRVRDNALRLQLIVVELTNEDDAYLIFETLNTRGKDLGPADLIKNNLTRMLRPTNKAVDIAKDKWTGILTLLILPRFRGHCRSHESAVGVFHGQAQTAGVHG